MEEIFVTKIHLNKVRHLENIDILLSNTERKHLILTGKNGSGKTSVLFEIRNYLLAVANRWLPQPNNSNFWEMYHNYSNQINTAKLNISNSFRHFQQNNSPSYWRDDSHHLFSQRNLKVLENEWLFLKKISQSPSSLDATVELCNFNELYSNLINGTFLTIFFDSKRINFIGSNDGISNQELVSSYGIRDNASLNFGQYIVNLKAQKSFAGDEGNLILVEKIDSWFKKFTQLLKLIFQDDTTELRFDSKTFNFYIDSKNKESFDFNTLSDGYSAVFAIVTEILMRMESKASQLYDLQGIVLIDEIETHLHIDLQRKILPFLTAFFPKIQFIVTTHSPFVLSSIDNAVIYDLEKKIRVEDLSDYKYHELVDTYFETNQYSDFVEKQVAKYEALIGKEKPTEQEEDELYELRKYFRKLPFFLSPELQLKIQSLELYPQTAPA